MNRYILIRRLMGPCILLLLGIVALLSQAHVVHFYLFFPLLLILIGVLKLAERAALAADGYPAPPQPWGSYPGAPQAPGPGGAPTGPGTAMSNSIVPSPMHDYNGNSGGGES
ncbi:MAG TPA: hypothetical protein VF730_14420 [Terracidiphilus sp.]